MSTEHRSGVEAAQDAPAPEDARKPAAPTDLHKRSWAYVFRKTVREFSADHRTDLAATLTYYGVLALFPALLALVSLLGVFDDGRRIRRLPNSHDRG